MPSVVVRRVVVCHDRALGERQADRIGRREWCGRVDDKHACGSLFDLSRHLRGCLGGLGAVPDSVGTCADSRDIHDILSVGATGGGLADYLKSVHFSLSSCWC